MSTTKNQSQTIKDTITDLVGGLLYWDRKDDVDLPIGDIQAAINRGDISIEQVVNHFRSEFTEGLTYDYAADDEDAEEDDEEDEDDEEEDAEEEDEDEDDDQEEDEEEVDEDDGEEEDEEDEDEESEEAEEEPPEFPAWLSPETHEGIEDALRENAIRNLKDTIAGADADADKAATGLRKHLAKLFDVSAEQIRLDIRDGHLEATVTAKIALY